MTPFTQLNLTDRKRNFKYHLSGMRRISETTLGYGQIDFECLPQPYVSTFIADYESDYRRSIRRNQATIGNHSRSRQ